MAIPKKIANFIEKNGLKVEEISHRKIYTALDKARTLKVKESLVAKTVVVKAGQQPFIVLTSSDTILNLEKLEKVISKILKKEVKKISFASEKWIKENLKGMKEGVIPPFGSLWKIPVIADKNLLKNSKIIVNSGSHAESLRLTVATLRKLEPELVEALFSKKRKKKGV